MLEVGCRQLGVYVKQLDTLTEGEALDIIREGHVVLVPHKEGDYTIIERQLGRRIEITTVNGSLRHGTVSRSSIAKVLADTESGVVVAKRELSCESLSVHDEDGDGQELTPLRRFLRLLKLESNDIWTVVLFALVSGVLGLATPLAVESLVNVVSWGTYLQPLVVLAVILLASLGLSGVLRVLQTVVVEIIQRRQFVRIVGDLAHRFPRAKRSYLKKVLPTRAGESSLRHHDHPEGNGRAAVGWRLHCVDDMPGYGAACVLSPVFARFQHRPVADDALHHLVTRSRWH